MKRIGMCIVLASTVSFPFLLSSCSTYSVSSYNYPPNTVAYENLRVHEEPKNYASLLPQTIATKEKVVVVDPSVHAWGAYGADGNLIRGGVATAGNSYCPDTHRPCRTSVGSFRITSLGSPECKSSRYPVGKGGAPMPYCMYFNNNQALHGSPASHVVAANVSHGCVRMHITDAEWLRYNFASVGTRVIVRPY